KLFKKLPCVVDLGNLPTALTRFVRKPPISTVAPFAPDAFHDMPNNFIERADFNRPVPIRAGTRRSVAGDESPHAFICKALLANVGILNFRIPSVHVGFPHSFDSSHAYSLLKLFGLNRNSFRRRL